MIKRFCDRCGRECAGNLSGRVHLTEIHETSAGELAGEDDYPSADLCDICVEIIKTALGKALTAPRQHRMEMLAEVPVAGWGSAQPQPAERP